MVVVLERSFLRAVGEDWTKECWHRVSFYNIREANTDENRVGYCAMVLLPSKVPRGASAPCLALNPTVCFSNWPH